MTKEELITLERKFLHDIANKLTIAQGMSDIVAMKLKKKSDVDEIQDKMEKCQKAIKDITSLVSGRREVLIAQQN